LKQESTNMLRDAISLQRDAYAASLQDRERLVRAPLSSLLRISTLAMAMPHPQRRA
jgi:hypothetical protein